MCDFPRFHAVGVPRGPCESVYCAPALRKLYGKPIGFACDSCSLATSTVPFTCSAGLALSLSTIQKNGIHPSMLWATPSSASLFRWMQACRHARMRACGDAGSQACGHAGMQACMHWFAIRSLEFQICVDVESIRGRFGIDLGSPSGRLWV